VYITNNSTPNADINKSDRDRKILLPYTPVSPPSSTCRQEPFKPYGLAHACGLSLSACCQPLSLTACRSAIESFGPEASRDRMHQPQVATGRVEPSLSLPSSSCRAGLPKLAATSRMAADNVRNTGMLKARVIAELISCHVCGAVSSSGYGALDTAEYHAPSEATVRTICVIIHDKSSTGFATRKDSPRRAKDLSAANFQQVRLSRWTPTGSTLRFSALLLRSVDRCVQTLWLRMSKD
jgi:hypothetical protein